MWSDMKSSAIAEYASGKGLIAPGVRYGHIMPISATSFQRIVYDGTMDVIT
jgi:hypothetical protein